MDLLPIVGALIVGLLTEVVKEAFKKEIEVAGQAVRENSYETMVLIGLLVIITLLITGAT